MPIASAEKKNYYVISTAASGALHLHVEAPITLYPVLYNTGILNHSGIAAALGNYSVPA
jgi:hypothetical protein